MKKNNALSPLRESIINRYEGSGYLTRQRAWFLYIFCLITIPMFIILAAALFITAAAKGIMAIPLLVVVIGMFGVSAFCTEGKIQRGALAGACHRRDGFVQYIR